MSTGPGRGRRTDNKRTLCGYTIWSPERAQTTQDFAVGIGIFLLAIGFAFSFIPTFISPFAGSSQGDTAQADRIAGAVLAEHANNPDRPNALTSFPEGNDIDGFGIQTIDQVNISIEETNQSKDFDDRNLDGVGNHYQGGQPAGSTARIVTIGDPVFYDEDEYIDIDEGDCEPACRLVVRVW